MEADLLATYQIDLLDLGSDRFTYRRLLALINGLPPTSATADVIRANTPHDHHTPALTADEEARLWKLEHHLLAGVLDALNAANWQRGGGKGTRPKPVTRPGVGAQKVIRNRSKLSQARKQEILNALKPGGEGL